VFPVRGIVLEHLVCRPEDVAMVQRVIDDASDDLADAVAEMRAAGASWASIGLALDVTPQAAAERYGCAPRRTEIVRLDRRVKSHLGQSIFPGMGRLTVADRFIYYALPRGKWALVRRCESPDAAVELATYLGEQLRGFARFIRRPGDFGGNDG
jgi:hypothetical protein